jgi:hypothetical protein
VIGNDIKVTLNGQFVSHLQNGNRSLKGFIDLQNNQFGSKVSSKTLNQTALRLLRSQTPFWERTSS